MMRDDLDEGFAPRKVTGINCNRTQEVMKHVGEGRITYGSVKSDHRVPQVVRVLFQFINVRPVSIWHDFRCDTPQTGHRLWRGTTRVVVVQREINEYARRRHRRKG